MKNEEAVELEDLYLNIPRKIDYNANLILELEERIKQLKIQKEEHRKRFEENEKNQKIKYDNLNRKYKLLLKSVNAFHINEEMKKSELVNNKAKFLNGIREHEDLDMYANN